MFFKLFLAFTLIPFVEIYLLIKIGAQVGAFNTILIVIVTGLLGASLARLEGIKTMTKVRESLNRGELPAEEMLDAMLIFTAGVVLLTPGFLTDLAGLTLLVPKARYWFKRWLRKKFDEWLVRSSGKGGTSIRF
ncbi:MAG: FxsA family protein [Deltaproteobacteria bacterium]|nr:MAG: FxsA family protein [Deltaproteobacteria bacterium]